MQHKPILWWGRYDPGYSRNRILRQALTAQGYALLDFRPHISKLGDVEARFCLRTRPELLWVPCFRQRDLAAAARWARRQQLPLLFDPLISAYDKQVFERKKLTAGSRAAARLLAWEQQLFAQADIILADTGAHAEYYHQQLVVPPSKLHVVPVGAEENLFRPAAPKTADELSHTAVEVLFFGSFIALQAPQVIIEAARLTQTEAIRWHLVGAGPLRASCQHAAQGLPNVVFEDWIPYTELAARIQRADIVLGVFGASAKAGRVIPNKVYQALACARPVVTLHSAAYPQRLSQDNNSGISWVAAASANELAAAVCQLANDPHALGQQSHAAYRSYQRFFSATSIQAALARALDSLAVS